MPLCSAMPANEFGLGAGPVGSYVACGAGAAAPRPLRAKMRAVVVYILILVWIGVVGSCQSYLREGVGVGVEADVSRM